MMILKMLPRWFIHTTIASGNGRALVEKKKKKNYGNYMNRTVKVLIQSEKAWSEIYVSKCIIANLKLLIQFGCE